MNKLPPRLVVVTNGNYFARLLLDPLLDGASDIAGVVVVMGDYQKRSKLHALFALSLCTAWPYLAYKVFSSLAMSAAARLDRRLALDVVEAAQRKSIPVLNVRAINSPSARDWVASLHPDVLVSVSCPQLIGQKMLQIPRVGSINVHSSLLPRYAGLAPYFWVLSNGESHTGISVHYMTNRFDAGNILQQAEVPIAPRESAFSLFRKLAMIGGPLLRDAVEMAYSGAAGVPQDPTQYSYYSHPTLKSYIALRERGHRLIRIREIRETLRAEAARANEAAPAAVPCRTSQ